MIKIKFKFKYEGIGITQIDLTKRAFPNGLFLALF